MDKKEELQCTRQFQDLIRSIRKGERVKCQCLIMLLKKLKGCGVELVGYEKTLLEQATMEPMDDSFV